MIKTSNAIFVTGGSDVYNGEWSNCNTRDLTEDKDPTHLQSTIDRVMGTYLLSRGLVGDTFHYFTYKSLVVIQTHKFGKLKNAENIFFASLLRYMIDHPADRVTVKNPYWFLNDGKEKCLSIRRRIEQVLTNLDIPTTYKFKDQYIHRLMFA